MTDREWGDALERIRRIEEYAQQESPAAFGAGDSEAWYSVRAQLSAAMEAALERMESFAGEEDPQVGLVRTDWTGDVRCAWVETSSSAAREQLLARFQRRFRDRIMLGHLLAAATRTAVTISQSVGAPWKAVSAIRAGWELVAAIREYSEQV